MITFLANNVIGNISLKLFVSFLILRGGGGAGGFDKLQETNKKILIHIVSSAD